MYLIRCALVGAIFVPFAPACLCLFACGVALLVREFVCSSVTFAGALMSEFIICMFVCVCSAVVSLLCCRLFLCGIG